MNFYTCFHNANCEKWKRICMRIPIDKPDVLFRYSTAIYMRINITVFFLAFFCLHSPAAAYGQGITISVKKAPLENVFKMIEKQSGYLFWCEKELLQKTRPVDVAITNATLEQALDACLKDQALTYAIKGKTIIIKAKEKVVGSTREIKISGRVVDEKGVPIPNVSVRQKKTDHATATDKEGKFQIEVTNENTTLQFTCVGYEMQEIQAGEALVVKLISSTSKLDEVQVIAYGTTTRRLNTGSVFTVTAKDIESQPVSNPLAALQGRVPGMVVTQTSGVAGSAFKVQIRGQSSLDPSLSQNNPLFIIDGVPFESGNSVSNQLTSAANNPTSTNNGGLSPLNTINSQDIESIDILKDADATSIYGSRGANGVIIITTKKGKSGGTLISLNANSGFSQIGRSMQLLNTQQYVQMRKEAFANDGLTPSQLSSDPGYAPDIMLWDTTRYTDFKDLLIGRTAHATNAQATISGGNDFTQFRIGSGYQRQTSVYPVDFADNVASVNFSINHKSQNQKFKIALTGMYANDKNTLPQVDLTRYLNLPPNLRLYDENGKLSWDEAGVVFNTVNSHLNPLGMLNQRYVSRNENLSGNFNLNYSVVTGLDIRLNLGYNRFGSDEVSIQPSTSIDPYLSAFVLPSAYFANSKNENWIIEPQINYNRSTKAGTFNILIGNTTQDKSGLLTYQYGSNYNSDLLLNSIAAAGAIKATNDRTKYRYAAFFARFNYNYLDRYILNLAARRDGSSRFGPDQQNANFGSIGAAWLFSNEKFVKDKFSYLSFGKIRASYGTTGNDQIGDYKFLNLWSSTPNPYNNISGLYPRSLYNPEYSWEINKKFEVSLDLGFLNDKLLFSSTYYLNRCNNQLINYNLPTQTGFANVVKNFPGLVQNSGWEFTVTSKNFNGNVFKWNTSFNISIPKNKLVSFPGLASSTYSARYLEGKSLSIIKGYRYLGVDPQTGVYSFEDLNKDGQFTTAGDYQVFGNTDPKFFGGLQNNLTYKNFEFCFFFQIVGQTGANYISQLSFTAPGLVYNQPSLVLHRWQRPGDEAEIQRFTAKPSAVSGAVGRVALSNGQYTDASFIKLRNVSLSYRLPKGLLDRFRIGMCRVYMEAQNLLTITGYKGSDPETQDFFVLPPLRTVVAGFQLNF
ncbi:SusC/RagA family TonB-linked outer membrane protein [Pedobacter borealis]|uniref:SusC/RagA family TonB-linked outer membrane protein n=1 Tax=Pedobacter borealis TaxID=475254 RepID=UPI0014288D49|nr:SusC/RagA family TonB-linked outer membrane protein [Pedobacter borealis]